MEWNQPGNGTRQHTMRGGARFEGEGQKRMRPSRIWSLLRLGWARSGRTLGVLSVWILVERLTAWRQRIRPIRSGAMLRYALGRHRGRQVALRDGTVIAAGDPIVELHFDNHRLVELGTSGTSPWPFLQQARGDLAELERLLASGAIPDVKALHGLTLFAAAGTRVGFEVRALPKTWRFALERFFLAGLVVLYHPAGWKAAIRHAPRWPGEVWMGRAALAHRYGGARTPVRVSSPRS